MISYNELNQRNRKLGLGVLSPVAIGSRFENSRMKEPIYGATRGEERTGELNFEDLMHLITVKSKKRDLFSFKESLKDFDLVEALHIPMNTFADKVEDESIFDRYFNEGNFRSSEFDRSLPSLVSKNITSVAPGADYAGFFRGTTNGFSINGLTFDRNFWNNFDSCFAFEAWVYLPSINLTVSADNENTNSIFGMGGPSSGGLQFCVRNTPGQAGGNPRLVLRNNVNNQEIVSSIVFPLNTWVKVGVSYNPNTAVTTMMINNHVDSVNGERRWGQTSGSSVRFHIGRADDNSDHAYGWNSAWKGYMSDVKMFLPKNTDLWSGARPFYSPVDTSLTWDSFSSDKELKSGIVEVNGVGLIFDRKAPMSEFLDSLRSAGISARIRTVFPTSLNSSFGNDRFVAAVLNTTEGGNFNGTIEIKKLKVGDVVTTQNSIPYTISNENEISNVFDFLGLTLKREGRKNSQTTGFRTQEVLAAGAGSGITGIGLSPL